MTPSEIEDRLRFLERRALHFERRLRRLQGAVGGLAVVAVSALLLGDAMGEGKGLTTADWGLEAVESAQPPVAAVLRTRRLEIVGEDDKRFVAVVGASEEGHGFLETWTGSGWRSTRLGSEPDGRGAVAVYDRSGHPLFRASGGAGRGGDALVGDGEGRAALHLVTGVGGEASLGLQNGAGREVALLTGAENRSGLLRLSAADGRPRTMLGTSANAQSLLELYNAAGYRMVVAAGDDRGNGRLSVHDAEGLGVAVWPGEPILEDPRDHPLVPPHLADPPAGTEPAEGTR